MHPAPWRQLGILTGYSATSGTKKEKEGRMDGLTDADADGSRDVGLDLT